ncbi:MAG: hypothetical protein WC299_01600 [Kiritimatiellia bacterium]
MALHLVPVQVKSPMARPELRRFKVTTNSQESATEPVCPVLNPEHLWNQLGHAIDLRSNEDQSLWTIFATFWGTNSILLVALFNTGDIPSNPVVGIVIAAVGVLFSMIWHGIQKRALGHLIRYEELMCAIETKLRIPPNLATSGEINREAFIANLGFSPKARTLMKLCSLTGVLLWVFALVLFVVKTPA